MCDLYLTIDDINMDINRIIEETLEFQKKNFPDRTTDYLKCYRDLNFILEAIQNDIKNQSNLFITRIANYFWYNGKRQIKEYDVEIAIYNNLSDILKNYLSNDEYNHAKLCISSLCDIVKNGPVQLKDLGSIIIESSRSAERCQRNWDLNKTIPVQDIDAILSAARNMPTKQNRNYYKIVASTNKEFNEYCYQYSIDTSNPNSINRNAQTNANLLLLYFENFTQDWEDKFNDSMSKNALKSIGISSGAAALAANILGYKTGFNQCLDPKPIVKKLNSLLQQNINGGLVLTLGIGYPNLSFQRNQVVNKDNIVINTVHTYNKNIQIYYL
jgi:nitroreductase